jgi:hypothetical protein
MNLLLELLNKGELQEKVILHARAKLEIHRGFCKKILGKGDYLEHPRVDETMIIKLIFRKCEVDHLT